MDPGEAGVACGILSSGTILAPNQDLSQAVLRNTTSGQLSEPSTEESKERSRKEAGRRLRVASESVDGV